jgi:ABC-type phosphate transport system ATPase subunit
VSNEVVQDPDPQPDELVYKNAGVLSNGEPVQPVYQMLEGDTVVIYNNVDPDINSAYVMRKDYMDDLDDESSGPADFWDSVKESLKTDHEVKKLEQRETLSRAYYAQGWLEFTDRSEDDGWISTPDPRSVHQ